MKILLTGSAGFIGSALALRLLERGDEVMGIDNHNGYYDQKLKEDRLARHINAAGYAHERLDIGDAGEVERVFSSFKPQRVINLAAQAGVGYSIKNPMAYVHSNLVGFTNILEGCRHHRVEHLVYASSSSVYGANTSLPFSEHNGADHPLSFYAATKKANELMAHTYSHLYGLPTSGLRFFTVYGPWGRPDMALFKFTRAILAGERINLHNFGDHRRDFTYIDDIVEGISRVLDKPALPNPNWRPNVPDPASSNAPWRILNIGSNNPIELRDYISALEVSLGTKAKLNPIPLQPGDVPDTFANVNNLIEDFGYRPATPVAQGIEKFVRWYRAYFESSERES